MDFLTLSSSTLLFSQIQRPKITTTLYLCNNLLFKLINLNKVFPDKPSSLGIFLENLQNLILFEQLYAAIPRSMVDYNPSTIFLRSLRTKKKDETTCRFPAKVVSSLKFSPPIFQFGLLPRLFYFISISFLV